MDRGFDYVRRGKVQITHTRNNGCDASARGTYVYIIKLGFSRIGEPSYSCSCPYYSDSKLICKHIIGAALVWDRFRNIPDPEEVASNIFDEEIKLAHDHGFCQLIASVHNVITDFTPEEQIGIIKFISTSRSNTHENIAGDKKWVCPSPEVQLGKLIDVVVKQGVKFTGTQHATLHSLKVALTD